MTNLLPALMDWLYPPKCTACSVLLPLNEKQRFICVRCKELFEPVGDIFCGRCGAPKTSEGKQCASCYGKNFQFTYNRASFIYEELIRDMLHGMKFRGKKRVALGLGELWASHMAESAAFAGFELIPMPMHPKKQRERGFNQAEVLTRPLSHALKIPVSNVLVRVVDTPPQSGLHPTQRAENVKDVFEIRKNETVAGKNYILTDDIFTTGASLNECAKTLKKAGSAQVLCMTLAVAVKNNLKP